MTQQAVAAGDLQADIVDEGQTTTDAQSMENR